MTDNTIQLEINDATITAEAGTMLIEVADANGIDIPRFCYHKKLSIAANCRMCLVDVENAPKPMPACATPVMDGMKVSTKSERARASQKSVMEFLLINHPLDCPICDQGGECDLQDLAVEYGQDFSRFKEKKRIVKDKNLGSLVSTDMTRCIHCTRCVRYGKEIAGIVEMGGLGRGEHMEIGTYVEKSLSSEMSGNIIDLCPVGALTSKPFRFQARSWELTHTESIAPHDAFGSNVLVQSINNKVVRVLPNDNEAVNEIWLSDRDRFSYLGLMAEDRVTQPLVRNKSGKLEPVSWQNAFDIAAAKLQDADVVNALMSPNSTNEEFFLMQEIMKGLGKGEVTAKLRHQKPCSMTSGMDGKIADISKMQTIVILGSDVQREMPLLSHRINQAYRQGAKVHALNHEVFDFNFKTVSQTNDVQEMLARLTEVAKVVLEKAPQDDFSGLTTLLSNVKVSETAQQIAADLLDADNALLVVGQMTMTSEDSVTLLRLAEAIVAMTDATLTIVDVGANTAGAKLAGADSDKSMSELAKSANALVLFGTELSADGGKDMSAVLSETEFVLACSVYLDDETAAHADLVLPIANFTETSGTFVNIQNDWQSFSGAVIPPGEARPGWKVLRVLGNHLSLTGFYHHSSEEVLEACKAQQTEDVVVWVCPEALPSNVQGNVPTIYQTDALVRHSDALQHTVLADAVLAGETS